jgi:hypothetical protein
MSVQGAGTFERLRVIYHVDAASLKLPNDMFMDPTQDDTGNALGVILPTQMALSPPAQVLDTTTGMMVSLSAANISQIEVEGIYNHTVIVAGGTVPSTPMTGFWVTGTQQDMTVTLEPN